MEKINRELLIKDICSRLPYGVYVKFQQYDNPLFLYMKDTLVVYNGGEMIDTIQYLYLRPMSSMTEEEKEHIKHKWCYNDWDIDGPSSLWRENILVEDAEGIIDYFNEHHLDFRGLIPMGLALEAPEGMYKTE